MKSKVDTKKSETEKILKAARQYVFKHGFRSLALDKLAIKLGMSVRSIYEHYHGKPLLITAVINDKMSEMDHDLEAIHSEDLTFIESMQMMLDTLYKHSREYSQVYIHDLTGNTTLFEWTRKLRRQMLERHFTEFFELGQREKTIRNDISAEMFNEVYLSLTNGLIIGNILKKTKGSNVCEVHKALFSMLLEGVLIRQSEPVPSRKKKK